MSKEEKYTVEEFFDKIQKGEIQIPVPIITGVHGAKYKRIPSQYQSGIDDKWCHKIFHFHGTKRAFIRDIYLNIFNFSVEGISLSKEEIILSKTRNVRCFSDEELRNRIDLLFDVVKISCKNIFFDGLKND